MEVAAELAVGLRAAGLGDDLDDAATGVAILRFEATGLDLHFLDEGLIDPAAKRTVGTCPDAQASEGRVIDGNAVRHIGILESAGAGNGRVVAAGLNAVDRAGAQIEKIGYTTLNGNILKESVGDIRGDRRRGSVRRDGGGADLHGLGSLAGLEDDLDAGVPADLEPFTFHSGRTTFLASHLSKTYFGV